MSFNPMLQMVKDRSLPQIMFRHTESFFHPPQVMILLDNLRERIGILQVSQIALEFIKLPVKLNLSFINPFNLTFSPNKKIFAFTDNCLIGD
jgi:hypothetical protein